LIFFSKLNSLNEKACKWYKSRATWSRISCTKNFMM